MRRDIIPCDHGSYGPVDSSIGKVIDTEAHHAFTSVIIPELALFVMDMTCRAWNHFFNIEKVSHTF